MKSFIAFLFFCCFSLPHLNAAITGYLKIDDIPGESQTADHEGEIDIHDVSWGVVRPLADETGSTRTRPMRSLGI